MSEFLGEGRIQANDMKLLVQPEHGIAPLLDAIRKAKKCVRILIFRFDRPEIEKALTDAVQRGVSVRAMRAAFAVSRCGCSNVASPSPAPPTTWCAITAR
jgi:phosphatidylserine/phosphatidylglycerophosphate/cardiolipin synthase-like enzyme